MNNQIQVAAMPLELETAVENCGLAPAGAHTLKEAFAPYFTQFQALAEEARNIAVNAPKAARAMRLRLRALRVAADKTRKELKEDSLRRGKAVDGINAVLEYHLAPIEEAMDRIEKAEELAAAERKAALKIEREALLAPFVANPAFYLVADMNPEAFTQLLESMKAAHAARIAAEEKAKAEKIAADAKAEAERIEREKAAAAERERVRIENETLKRQAAEREEVQRQEREKAAEERAELQRQAEAAAAAARKEREAAERKAAEERQKREQLEAEIRKKEEAERARKAADLAAARKAAAAPDKKKIHTFAGVIEIHVPALSPEAGEAQARIQAQVTKFAAWLRAEAEKL